MFILMEIIIMPCSFSPLQLHLGPLEQQVQEEEHSPYQWPSESHIMSGGVVRKYIYIEIIPHH